MRVTFEDYRRAAKRRLPGLFFDYVDGGSYAEHTLAANTRDFGDVLLRQRVLKNVSKLETAVDLFGTRHAMPVVLAPIGMAGLLARRGEVQAARAAKTRGNRRIVSSQGSDVAGEGSWKEDVVLEVDVLAEVPVEGLEALHRVKGADFEVVDTGERTVQGW